ncbi:MAG: protein kinase [Candidatus Aminicenantes bacterium]|nr:protein kinase [Candidatus Aminicenantes bacterium]
MDVTCPNCGTENTKDSEFCKKCGTQIKEAKEKPLPTQTLEALREELATGSTFAERYQIIEELGRGGMGRVYRVLDKNLNEEVALKLIKPEIASDEKTVQRFSNELKVARKIAHKNIGKMFDLNDDEGTKYITMEYVSGQDLKGLIKQSKQLNVGTAISIAKQMAEGLAEAHRLGIVHRDLKPSNVMIDKDGDARIMDFGIARSVASEGITDKGVMIGTPDYMSPEQVEGKDIDHRTDIYSLGVILYEMVTGRVPFEGDTPFTIGMKHKGEIPRPPKELNAQVQEDLNRVILRCLEKNKETRYQSAGEMLSELENIEKGIPTAEWVITERKPLTSREITITLGLKRLFIPVLVLIAVVLIGLFVWHPWSIKKAVSSTPSDKPSLAVVYFENNTGDEELDNWGKGISDLLITDLMQSKYLKVLGGDRLFDILSQMDQLEAKSYSSEVLKEIAAQGGVNHIARGSYSKAGDILRIDMVLQDARSGEPITTQRVEGKGEASIFAMVDELTKWTKESLQVSSEQMANDLDKQIGTVATSSPEAYKFYTEGVILFNKKQEYQQSIESLEKAILLDPGFAMAYRKMAVAFSNMGKWEERKKYMQKAMALSDRLTEREKLLIEGSYFGSSESTYDKAIESYEKLIALYQGSDEAISALTNLGVLYGQIEDWDKAIEHTEAAIKAGSEFSILYTNLAFDYMAKGEYDKAGEALKEGIGRFNNFSLAHWTLARLYAFQGRFDLALDEVEKAAAIDPTYTKAQFYHMSWDFEKAEEEYKKWFNHVSPSTHLSARERLSYLYRTRGQFEEAKNQILLGIDEAKIQKDDLYLDLFHHQWAYLCLMAGSFEEALEAVEKNGYTSAFDTVNKFYDLELEGWILAEMGRMDEARKTAEEIKGLVDTGPFKKHIRHYHFLMGMIELKTKNYSEAIGSFKKAASLLPHPVDFITDDGLYRYFLALAYHESGDLQAARDEFEALVGFIPGRNTYGDLYAESYYKLGQIYEQQGNTAKARENYEKFLSLWKDADPNFPEVEDARKRLAGLRAENP